MIRRLLKTLLYGLLLFTPEVTPARINARKSANEASLYSDTDNVIMLDIGSLRPALDLNNNKLVQFLNSFCGDCHRFAPIFKTLSRDLYKWRRILRIYGVDCAQERNAELCRDFNIRQTPSLRFFGPDTQKNLEYLGSPIQSQDPKFIKAALADLVSQNDYGTGQPNFKPVKPSDSAKTLFLDYQSSESPVQYIALVLQPNDSKIGRDTLLELLPYKEVAVRIVGDAQLFSNFGLEPSNQKLAIIDRSGKAQLLSPSLETYEAYATSVGDFLKSLNFKPDPPLPIPVASNFTEFLDQQHQAILDEVLKPPFKVYRADLEQAIDKLLHIELRKWPVLEGTNLIALKTIITVLNYLNPLNKDGKLLLSDLHNSLDPKLSIKGAEFGELVDSLEKGRKVFKGRRYVGCIGSRPLLRGFTCSMWTLFHYLTVQSAKPPNYFSPGSILNTIYGFAKYFFGCTDCSEHFQQMAVRRNMSAVNTYDEEILWLWAAHNEVNQRIAGDTTEDPKFPKIQFPNAENCPTCRDANSQWRTDEVLKYLKNLYDIKNVSFYGLPTPRGYD
ncbi:sulfhydryl oxidase 1-like [Drosophila eugracilis]|uniref:sulfhydryl oxidase 1-like n=1 Tax=Drosophila eugracilis TaxID=29029 RepID=UPI001BD97038|nr:sulfhydryl oxidase 1-like [Drosophila eugracilis]